MSKVLLICVIIFGATFVVTILMSFLQMARGRKGKTTNRAVTVVGSAAAMLAITCAVLFLVRG